MEFRGICGAQNLDDTSSSMEFHGTSSAPISLTRAVPWKSRGIPWNLEYANFDDTSSSMEFHGTWGALYRYTGTDIRHHRVRKYPPNGPKPPAGTVLTAKVDRFSSKSRWLWPPGDVIHKGRPDSKNSHRISSVTYETMNFELSTITGTII